MRRAETRRQNRQRASRTGLRQRRVRREGPLRRIPRRAVHRDHRHWRRQGRYASSGHRSQFHVAESRRRLQARARRSAPPKLPTRRYRKVRACTAHSAAPTPGISWPPAGPDFRRNFSDPLPASNADIGMTLAKLLELGPAQGSACGPRAHRSSERHTTADPLPTVTTRTETSRPGANGLQTLLKMQTAGHPDLPGCSGFPRPNCLASRPLDPIKTTPDRLSLPHRRHAADGTRRRRRWQRANRQSRAPRNSRGRRPAELLECNALPVRLPREPRRNVRRDEGFLRSQLLPVLDGSRAAPTQH